MVVKTFAQIFWQTYFANNSGPFLAGGCHCLFDGLQHEFRWCFHAASQPVEMRLVDGFEAFLTSEIQCEGVVGDILDRRYQVVCRRQLRRDFFSIDYRPVLEVGVAVADDEENGAGVAVEALYSWSP